MRGTFSYLTFVFSFLSANVWGSSISLAAFRMSAAGGE
jgi:hypothetical protein